MKLRNWIDMNKIDWRYLSTNPNAIHLLEQNQDEIYWDCLAENPSALHLLEQNPDKIKWNWLSKNPNAIHLLEQNQDKINWDWLSENPNAIHLLEQNPDKIYWLWLFQNPVIFTYDYTKLKQSRIKLHKDLIEYLWHPSTIQKWIKQHCDQEDDGFDLYTYYYT